MVSYSILNVQSQVYNSGTKCTEYIRMPAVDADELQNPLSPLAQPVSIRARPFCSEPGHAYRVADKDAGYLQVSEIFLTSFTLNCLAAPDALPVASDDIALAFVPVLLILAPCT